jgi:hypothetical protein
MKSNVPSLWGSPVSDTVWILYPSGQVEVYVENQWNLSAFSCDNYVLALFGLKSMRAEYIGEV